MSSKSLLRAAFTTLLKALFILALASRMYAAWTKGFEDPLHQPQTIISGESLAPHQYRVLYPLLWKGLSPFASAQVADHALTLLTIVLCYAVLYHLFARLTRHAILAGLTLLAFHAACSHPYQFQFRDTFLEITFIAIALQLIPPLAGNGSWKWFAVLSVLGTLNRETWAFVLLGAGAATCFEAGGPRPLLRAPAWRPAVIGLLLSGLLSLAVFVGVRFYFGHRPYYCKPWPWDENVQHFLFWKVPGFAFGHGVWAVGAGAFILLLWSVALGNRKFLPFLCGYLVPYLPVTFAASRWMESRIFFPIFVIVMASLATFTRQTLASGTADAAPEGRGPGRPDSR